jgi:cold shock CspA family protein
LIGQRLSARLDQPFIVENRAGAQGQIATEAVTRAPADGHTLLLVVPGNGIANVLYDKLNFNFIRDTAPVAGISSGPLLMEVSSAIPSRTSQSRFIVIQPQGGGRDVFVHVSAVERAGLSTLNEGQHIEYEVEENRGKTSAVNLKVK